MKNVFKSLVSAGLAALFGAGALGGGIAFAETQEHAGSKVPAAAKTENVACGKQASFRSLTDMSAELPMYDYFPDNGGIDGTGCYASVGNVMTDGQNKNWMGHGFVNATAGNTVGWAFIDLGQVYDISSFKVTFLSKWVFFDVIIQASDDPSFTEGVTTVFSSTNSLTVGETTVYAGEKIGCNSETKDLTGWNGAAGVDSYMDMAPRENGNVFPCDVTARYVRLTNTNAGNGGADSNTNFTEIEVYAQTEGIIAPKASVAAGTYESLESVTLSASALYEGAKIYYTLDGSYPTEKSTLYEGPIDFSDKEGAVALRAITVVNGEKSRPADYQYKIVQGAYKNQALGREVTFRKLSDMNEVLPMYDYFPDGNGINKTGCYELSAKGQVMTDGTTNWDHNTNATAGNTMGWAFVDLGNVVEISEIKVYFLSAWCFQNVVIQASNDPLFKEGVTTIFSVVEILKEGETVVYDGGSTGCSEETRAQTGWNGAHGVDSKPVDGNVFACNVSARYVRLTNTNLGNGGADSNTNFSEIEIYGGAKVPADVETERAVTAVKADLDGVEVPAATTKEEAVALLPENVTLVTTSGEVSVAASWSCENYDGAAAGDYTFALGAALPANTIDLFGVLEETTVTVTVLPAADKTALNAAITKAEALVEGDYTAASFGAVSEALAAARSAADNGKVTQAEADSCARALEDAMNKLVALAKDKTALKAKIDEAKAIDGEEYLSAGVTALGEALGAAEVVYADAQASEKEAADALKALTEALEALEEKADTTALEGLVAEVKAAAYDGENYTAASFAALEDALAEAEELLAKAEISKTDADGAKTALETAVEGLVAFGDPAALKALIAEVKAFSAADYVKNGFDALTAEIANAEAVAATKDVQSIYDAAKAALEEKKGALVSLVALKEAVAEAKEYEKEGYTELSYSALKTALSEAELVLAKANATADEITAAVGAVNAAVEGLEEKTPVPPPSSDSGSDSQTDSNSEKESGCGSVAGFSGAIALLAGCAILLKKKQR